MYISVLSLSASATTIYYGPHLLNLHNINLQIDETSSVTPLSVGGPHPSNSSRRSALHPARYIYIQQVLIQQYICRFRAEYPQESPEGTLLGKERPSRHDGEAPAKQQARTIATVDTFTERTCWTESPSLDSPPSFIADGSFVSACRTPE